MILDKKKPEADDMMLLKNMMAILETELVFEVLCCFLRFPHHIYTKALLQEISLL